MERQTAYVTVLMAFIKYCEKHELVPRPNVKVTKVVQLLFMQKKA